MEYKEKLGFRGLEKLITFRSKNTQGIIAIDSTRKGQALGGLRMYNYNSYKDALDDAVRLAKAMTQKNDMVDLPYGGGKSVILSTPNINKKKVLQEFAEILNKLKGEYIAVDDVGTSIDDMEYIRKYSKFARGRYYNGYQIPATSYGVYLIMKTVAKKRWEDGINNKKVIVEGLGKVGYNLCKLLAKHQCQLYVYDIDKSKEQELSSELSVQCIKDFQNVESDFFSPCAMSGSINSTNIGYLRTSYIIGGANNQIIDHKIFPELQKRKILWIPDYLSNSGGVIDIYCEDFDYCEDFVFKEIEKRIIPKLEWFLTCQAGIIKKWDFPSNCVN